MTDAPDGDVASQTHAFVPPEGYPNKTLCAICNLGEAAHIVKPESPEDETCICTHTKQKHATWAGKTVYRECNEDGCDCKQWDPGDTSGRLQEVADVIGLTGEIRTAAGKKENILEEANRIVSGSRQAMYGSPGENFRRIAAMWTEILGVTVDPEDIPLCLIALKLSREIAVSNRDNWVDIAGYARTREMLEEEDDPSA